MVVWSHPPNDEDTQMLAEDYLRMGIARAQKAEVPEPFEAEIDKTILVVGGGQSGMTAALEAARAGYEVVLVEKEPQLGGWLKKFAKLFPKQPPYRDLEPVDLESRVSEIEQNERIKVYLGATIEKISGQPGQFDVSLRTNGSTAAVPRRRHRAGHRLEAVRRLPARPSGLRLPQRDHQRPDGGAGRGGQDQPSLRRQAGPADRLHPVCRLPGRGAPALLLGRLLPRDAEAGPAGPGSSTRETQAYVLYKDIRAPGQYEDFYRRAQEDPGIFFTKGEVVAVEEAGDGNLVVDVENTLIDEHIQIEADLVVLATGMVPVAADGEAIRQFRDAQAVIEKGEAGAQLEAAKKTVEKLQASRGDGHPAPRLPAGAGPAGAEVPVPRFAFHLLPLRDPADGHLRGRVRARAERHATPAGKTPRAPP